jgi:hypothetical protein
MSPLPERRSRRELEKRAYRLGLVTAGAGLLTIVLVVLAIAGVTSFGIAFLTALITAACGYGFKKTVS